MQLRDIEYVAAVAECTSFSRAAEKLYVSQPALSQQIAHLEQELQVQLFIRDKKSVRPTPACTAFLREGRELLRLRDRLLLRMRSYADSPGGELNLAVDPFHYKSYLVPILLELRRQYPNIRINVREAFHREQISLLQQGKLDLAITSLPITEIDLKYETLFSRDILLAVPRYSTAAASFMGKESLTVEDLAVMREESFLMYEKGRHMRDVSMELCRRAGFEPRIVFETQNCDTINTLIAQGLGLAFVPSDTVEYCPADKRPLYFGIRDSEAVLDFALAWREDHMSPEADLVRAVLLDQKKQSD